MTERTDYLRSLISEDARPEPQTRAEQLGSLISGERRYLNRSDELLSIANQHGLAERANAILAQKGEEADRIFSGGMISDIFDALNILQYGVVGTFQGKGFLEGVKTRASFTKDEQLKSGGIPGLVAGIALDIAFDPLTYIAPWSALKKIPGFTKGIKATGKIAKSSKLGNWLGRKFIYRFGQDPIYAKMAERTIKNIAIGNTNLIDIVRPLTKLSPKAQKAIGAARKAGKLEALSPELLRIAKPAFDELDALGARAVKEGLLSKEVWEKNLGKYLPRLYRSKEVPGKQFLGLFPRKPKRVEISRFLKRKDLPEEVRSVMGEILEAGYPTAKGLVQLNAAVENASMFNKVAGTWAKEAAEEGLKKLPVTKKLAGLSGKHVPEIIFDDIQEIIRAKTPFQKASGKVMAGFKFGKVIMNPATHARNVMSNLILNNFEGLHPSRVDIYLEAGKDLFTKGKWYKEAKKVGLGLDTFAAREIKDLLISPTGLTGITGKAKKAWRGTVNTLSKLYEGEENFAKLAQYIFQRKNGLSPKRAWQIAERATFNYAQVTPFIRHLRESIFGFPFITFTAKATPQVAKTLATKPTKISNIGKIKNAIENLSDIKELKRERAAEPQWIKDGFYVKLPVKDKHGRSAYLDLTYIMPFGDLISGQLIDRKTRIETGLPESPAAALASKSPVINLIKELTSNQDFYGNKIARDSDSLDTQLGDVLRHITKTYLPPLLADQIPGGYRTKGRRAGERRPTTLARTREAGRGTQFRTLSQEMLRNLGIKIQPIDVDIQETYSEWEKTRALETMLSEAGVLGRYEKTFVPKEKNLRKLIGLE
jgi:hypothetical protein